MQATSEFEREAPSKPKTTEAFDVLLAAAERALATEEAPLASVLAARALHVTAGGDFAVSRDALAALLRRQDSSRDVRVVRTPDGYRTARRGRRGAPYLMWLGADADGEIEASCTCADYGKSGLGLCKHLLAALASPRPRLSPPRALRWDPVRPLTGPGERLARLWLDPRAPAPRALAELFQHAPAGRPIDPARLTGDRRRDTIESLLRACRRAPNVAEPAILAMLEQELGALDRGLGPVTARELARLLRGFKQPLYPYQRDGVAAFLGAGSLLLADDMGLGKTAQAIASCHALLHGGHISRAMIVAPAPLKPQWLREWQRFTDLDITLVDGGPEQRAESYRQRRGVLLVNYEQLLRDLPSVLAFAPELVVLDEAQRIKNWETRTAAVVKQLAPRWRLVLTGTPMENRLDELASIMEWVDEHALEPRWRLASWHSVRADGTRETTGARNLDTLRARIAPAMLRRVRREVLAQLPPRRDTIVPLALTPEQSAAHHDLDQPIASLLSRGHRRPLTPPEFLRLMTLLAKQRMICNALALPDFAAVWPELATSRRVEARLGELGSPKLLDLRERLVDLAVTQQRKVVVFSQWRRMLQLAEWATRDVLARAGARAVFFTGEESQRRRTENLVAFHDDPSTRVLFASDAGGVGLNLQRAASCCINLELPWNPAVLEQRIGRIYRLGQTLPIEVYNYVGTGGIEERIAQLVGDKSALFTGLFDGTTDEIAFESSGSFLSRVQRLVDPPQVAPAVAEADAASDRDEDSDEGDLSTWQATAPVAPPPSPDSPTLEAAQLEGLARAFAAIEARPLPDGRIAVELPAPAAAALGGLLRSLAAAFEASARPQA